MNTERDQSADGHAVRLQAFLASSGLGSRRGCEELIRAGRVTVDGEVATLGCRVDPDQEEIALDGEVLRSERKQYFALNKPRGVLCTNSDPSGRPRVIDLFPPNSPRLFTVGRLDEQSEGLILVTNDGAFANRLAHPRYRIYRTYRVQVAGQPSRQEVQQLERGLFFPEGKFRARRARFLKSQGKSAWLELQLTEGFNREVRRMLARVGYKVMRLQRVAFGPVNLGRLASGEYRPLRADEVQEIEALVERNIGKSDASPAKSAKRRKGAAKKKGRRRKGKP